MSAREAPVAGVGRFRALGAICDALGRGALVIAGAALAVMSRWRSSAWRA
jgi:hypothetical protein